MYNKINGGDFLNLSKKIIKNINKCANDNCYTIYITSIESVLYITSQTSLATLKPKTSRDLLYSIFKMLQSKDYGDGKSDYFFNTKKNKIIPTYINDNIDNIAHNLYILFISMTLYMVLL